MVGRSMGLAAVVAASVQWFTVGVLAPVLPREVTRPVASAERTLRMPGSARVRVLNPDGALEVNAYPGKDVVINATIRAYAPWRIAGQECLAGLGTTVQAKAMAGEIIVQTGSGNQPESVDVRVDYRILVPEGTALEAEGINGNMAFGPGCGAVSVIGGNTDVHVNGPRGKVAVRTTNGRIRLYDAPEGAELSTVNGNIYAHMLGGALHAETTNGHIVATLLSGAVAACDLNATNGGITLAIPGEHGARVDAATQRGVVRSDFEETSGTIGRRDMRAEIQGGGTLLSLRSLNGNIWLTRSK